jgi:hypothetical protein
MSYRKGMEGRVLTTTNRNWESLFATWGKPPSETEKERCAHAVTAVQKAIAASAVLVARGVQVAPQGSYLNNTNVRMDSDVDLAVRCSKVILSSLPNGVSLADVGLVPADYSFATYKNDVEAALLEYFGAGAVTRANKAFDIHENTYRVDADAAPCMAYRQYFFNDAGELRYHEGYALVSDKTGRQHASFPDQQKANGIAKNKATGMRFKQVVRIVKRLRNEMKEAGYDSASHVSSFFIESLVWNIDDLAFLEESMKATVLAVLAKIWAGTRPGDNSQFWFEENGIRPLFGAGQEWTAEQANAFAADAWRYVTNG